MVETGAFAEFAVVRVAVLSACHDTVLAEGMRRAYTLPRVYVSRRIRAAREIQRQMLLTWGVRVFVVGFVSMTEPALCVTELLSGRQSCLCAVLLDYLRPDELSDDEHSTLGKIAFGQVETNGCCLRIGWIRDALTWVREEIGSRAQITGEVVQYNAGGSTVLARLPLHSGGSYWLKAVGAIPAEYSVTCALAQWCMPFLPAVLAQKADWNAWIMEDGGPPFDRMKDAGQLTSIVSRMAQMQRQSAPYADALLRSGAADQRGRTAAYRFRRLFAYLEGIVGLQKSTRAPRIAVDRLAEIEALVNRAYGVLASLHVPDAVLHNDLNCGNILLGTRTCVFVDWCEAGVGCPFVMLHAFDTLIPDGAKPLQEMAAACRKVYHAEWAGKISEREMDIASAVTAPLAIAEYLYGRGDWLYSDRRNIPEVQAYARSLVRRIDRAVQSPSFLGAL